MARCLLCAILVAGWLVAPRPQSAPAALAGGRVVEIPGATPARGVLVTMWTGGDIAHACKVITDDAGKFACANLPPGPYHLTAERAGDSTGAYQRNDPDNIDSLIDLPPLARRTDLRIQIWKNPVIAGTLRDEVGDPLPGVTVQSFGHIVSTVVFGAPALSPRGRPATTDDRGAFRLIVPPGDFIVAAAGTTLQTQGDQLSFESSLRTALPPLALPDGTEEVYRTTAYGAPASPQLIHADAGDTITGIDITMTPVKAVRVAGDVQWNGAPAAGVQVRLRRTTADDTPGAAAITSTTGPHGEFTFPGVVAGSYFVNILDAPPESNEASTGAGTTRPMRWAHVPIVVADRTPERLSIQLEPAITVSGRCMFDGQTPPAAKDVDRLFFVTTSADGPGFVSILRMQPGTNRFSATGVAGGRYAIRLPTLAGWTVRSITTNGRDITDLPFDVAASVDDLVVTFTDRITRVGGAVRLSNGAADADVVVIAFPWDYDARVGQATNSRHFAGATVDASGAYALTTLVPGTYAVAAIHGPGAIQLADLDELARIRAAATRVQLREGESVRIDLTPIVVR